MGETLTEQRRMGETLTEQRRVSDDGPMGCKALL